MIKNIFRLMLFIGAVSTPAFGWETAILEVEGKTWESIGLSENRHVVAEPGRFLGYGFGDIPAEHTMLSEISLKSIGANDAAGPKGNLRVRVLDLNAMLVRNKPDSKFEDYYLKLQAPAAYAGLPDYSYTMYDWINKNEMCPLTKSLTTKECHNYTTWQGAVLNSSHFGDQATATYKQYHQIALNLAVKARTLRKKLSKYEIERVLYEDFVKEIEHEALAFEAIGQHYFQDRWAIGHMWNRWNGPDPGQLAFKNLGTNVAVGLFSGVIHGTEYKSKRSDPMGAAWIFNNVAHPSTFRIANDPTVYYGMGDDHLSDLYDVSYGRGKSYAKSLAPLDYQKQFDLSGHRDTMIDCLARGWAEVIDALGDNDGSHGASGIPMNSDVSTSIPGKCFTPWATNYSMALGLATLVGEVDFGSSHNPDQRLREHYAEYGPMMIASAVRMGVGAVGAFAAGEGDIPSPLAISLLDRQAFLRVFWNAWKVMMRGTNSHDTGLAKNAFAAQLKAGRSAPEAATSCTSGLACAGSAYKPAKYLEPANLDTLSETAEGASHPGRDKETLFSFYNKAHTDHWCKDEVATRFFARLRGQVDELSGKACRYMGSRFWHRTRPSYGDGPQKVEWMVYYKGELSPALPVCSIVNGSDGGSESDDVPRYLHAGYVPRFVKKSKYDDALTNWCKQIPVVDYVNPAEDIVASVSKDQALVTLSGLHFGDKKGRVFVWQGSDDNVFVDLKHWSSKRIRFNLPSDLDAKDGHFCLGVERDDGVISEGQFVLEKLKNVRVSLRGESQLLKIGETGCALPK